MEDGLILLCILTAFVKGGFNLTLMAVGTTSPPPHSKPEHPPLKLVSNKEATEQ